MVLLRTTLPPSFLLERGRAIEDAYERVRDERQWLRTLDVDIVTYQGVICQDAVLTLPHPHAHERAFVMVPWRDVDPRADIPGHGAVADLLAGMRLSDLRPRRDKELRLPE